MKKILYLLIIVLCVNACKEKDEIFNANVADVQIEFEALRGSAIMTYSLPKRSDIYYIQVSYINEQGTNVIKKASYLDETIELTGFLSAKQDVPLDVTLLDSKNNVTKSKQYTFDVLASTEFSLFESLEVTPYWDGFKLTYKNDEDANGLIHIGYKGINPYTQSEGTLLITSERILKGEQEILCPGYANDERITDVVIWTEDIKGNLIKEVNFDAVKAVASGIMDHTNISVEANMDINDEWCIGPKYLFNGDKNGVAKERSWGSGASGKHHACVSNAYGVPSAMVIDLKQPEVLAQIRWYCPLFDFHYSEVGIWNGAATAQPNHVKVYVSNDKNAPDDQWIEQAEFFEPKKLNAAQRWTFKAIDPDHLYYSWEQMETLDPCFMEINFDVSEVAYQYVKLEVISTFDISPYNTLDNHDSRWLCQELELYVKQ